MGFYVRKSVNFGPLRVNLSRSGVGYSVGGRGFRTGVRADGRRYTRASVPGTGVGYHHAHSRSAGSGCLLYVALITGTLAAGTITAASTTWAASA
jgi:hypothetical protein